MKRFAIRSLGMALAVLIAATGSLWASGPDKGGSSKSKSTQTVTETELKARLVGVGTQAGASGYAESKVITVTNKTTNVSTTNSSLSISVKRLKLADGAKVTVQLNGKALGTASVKRGSVVFSLSTKRGNTVPVIVTGDTFSVLDPDGSTVDLNGKTGAAVTETEGGDGKDRDGKDRDGKDRDGR